MEYVIPSFGNFQQRVSLKYCKSKKEVETDLRPA